MENKKLENILIGLDSAMSAATANNSQLEVTAGLLGFDTESADLSVVTSAIDSAVSYDFDNLAKTKIAMANDLESEMGNVKLEMFQEASMFGMDARTALKDIESFDGYEPNIARKLTIATNVAGINEQDEAFELIFPTIQLGATEGGIAITEEVYSVFEGVTQNTNKISGYKNKKNIIDLMRTGFNYGDHNKLQPLWSEDYRDYLIEELKTVSEIGGRDREIAPIMAGVEAPILDLGLTPEMKEDANVTYTDGISPFITIDQVAFKGVKDDKTGYIVIDNTHDLQAVATPSTQGDNKDYVLNVSTEFALSSSTVVKGGIAITDIIPEFATDGLLDGYTIKLTGVMSGSGNLVANKNGSVVAPMSLSGVRNSIDAVYDATGVKVIDTTSAIYAKAKEIAERFSFAGYIPSVRLTMNNIRVNNLKATYDSKGVFIDVPYLSGIELPEPILLKTDSSDAAKLKTILTGHALLTNTLANEYLLGKLRELKRLSTINEVGTKVPGLSTLSNTYGIAFSEMIFNPNIVDVQNTPDKVDAINAAFSQKLAREINILVTKSNFKFAKKAVTGSDVLEFLVVVGSDLADVISEVNIPEVNCKVVYKDHIDYYGKVRVLPVNLSGNKSGKTADAASFGNRITRPTLTATFAAVNGRKNEQITASFPAIRYVCNIPFAIDIDVQGVNSFIDNKVAVKLNN